MPGLRQQGAGAVEIGAFDQEMIAVESGDDEDAEAGIGQGRDHREYDAGLVESEGALEFETGPAGILPDIGGNALGAAEDRQLLIGPGDADEALAIGPGGDGIILREA